jgi:HK97 gp10 family phage protein
MAMSGVVFNRFPEIAAKFPVQLHDAVVQMTGIIVQLAQANAPVDTGFLRDSIVAEMIDEFSGTVTVGAYYGIYVEMGTRFMAAQPYFYPAVDEGSTRWEAVLAAMVTFL